MASKYTLFLVAFVAAIGAGGYGLYLLGAQHGRQHLETGAGGAVLSAPDAAAKADSDAGIRPGGFEPVPQGIVQGEAATRRHIASGVKAGDVDPKVGKRVLYYHDPMVPGNRFDKPARSPFMDMMLVPVYADDEGDREQGGVSVSSRVRQNLGVRIEPVVVGTVSPELSAVGTIAFNERDQILVQARATGYIERLHVRATLDRVTKGQALADLYIPAWIAAQEEFLAVRRMQGSDFAPVIDAARQRMRQVGMSDNQIAIVEGANSTQPRLTLTAPIAGVITELNLREGMTVTEGSTLVRINGLSTVWADAEVPESQVALVRPGMRVKAVTPSVPGRTFSGTVQTILPEVHPLTRTLKARLELANPAGRLVPGMFVQMQFNAVGAGAMLLVPTEAIIRTGRRTVVIRAEDSGVFRSVEVETGIESAGQTEIRRGLQAGQRVVASGQFLIDSEASLKGLEARLGASVGQATVAAQRHAGEGRIEAVGGGSVTLSHGPIASLKWGSMTMDFLLPDGSGAGLPAGLSIGDRAHFEFYMDAEDQPRLTALKPSAGSGRSPGRASPGRHP